MEFNWSTFLLEAVNFVVLVWILKRLLYKPVLKAMRERQKNIRASLEQAQKTKEEAVELQEKFRNRLKEWEEEKTEKFNELKKEIEQEKLRQEKLLAVSLEKEKEKNRAIEEKRKDEILKKSQIEGLQLGTRFSSQLLKEVSGPETEKNIIDLFLKNIHDLPEEKLQQMKNGFFIGRNVKVIVRTAYTLKEEQKEKLQKALKPLFTAKVGFQFLQDKELIAGISVSTGPLLLAANLRDELSFFNQVTPHGE